MLSEAQFNSAKLEKVTTIYGRLFGKRFGSPFKLVFIEYFQTIDGIKGSGFRMYNEQGYCLRFNYAKGSISSFNKESDRETLIVDSIDFWKNDNFMLDKPSLHVDLPRNMNVLKIYDKICAALKRSVYGAKVLGDANND